MFTATTREYSHYLLPEKGTCDIFFPTHFRTLEQLYHAVAANVKVSREQTTNPLRHLDDQTTNPNQAFNKKSTKILSNRKFMQIYAELEQTTALSGFNPLLEDYINMHFFVSE